MNTIDSSKLVFEINDRSNVYPVSNCRKITLDWFVQRLTNRKKKCVQEVNESSSSFITLDGLKQEDAFSNVLFNIAIEGTIRRAGVQKSGIIITRCHMRQSDT